MAKNDENIVRVDDIINLIKDRFGLQDNIIKIDGQEIYCIIEASNYNKSCSVIMSINGNTEKEARVLDKCKQILKRGKHRKLYYLTIAYDESSKYMAEKIYPYLSKYERLLRYLIYLTFINTLGNEWVNETLRYNKNIKLDTYNPDDILEKFNFDQFDSFLFDDIYYYNPIETLDSVTKALNNEDFNVNNWKFILNSKKPYSIRSKYFKEKQLDYVKNNHDNLRKFRNKVMHNKNIDYDEFIENRKLIRMTNKQLENTIEGIKSNKYETVNIKDLIVSIGNLAIKANNVASGVLENMKPFYSAFASEINNIAKSYMEYNDVITLRINNVARELNDNLKFLRGISSLGLRLDCPNNDIYKLSRTIRVNKDCSSKMGDINSEVKAKIIKKWY